MTDSRKTREELALSDFSSACYQMEDAARRYYDAVVEWLESLVTLEAQDPRRRDEEVDDILWEIVDNADAVIYTHKARAIVVGAGEDQTREDYASEYGLAEGDEPTIEALAHSALVAACRDTVAQMEAWREEYA